MEMKQLKQRKSGLLSLFLAAVLIAGSNLGVLAQGTASISGRVERMRIGEPIAGATVSVTNEETGATQTLTTDDAGIYRLSSLPPGRYTVKGHKQGFQYVVHTGITLAAGKETALTLKIGLPPTDWANRKPRFVPAAQASFLRDEDQVVGVNANGIARAYRTTFMAVHHIIEDQLGGTPVLATW